MSRPAESIDEIVALYDRWGPDLYDEELSQLDHALQTAALAVAAHASDELVIAALLHDVGHLLDLEAKAARSGPLADLHHETAGSKYLASLLPPSVTRPIALHVRAKRYRCAVQPAYQQTLSSGSQLSLQLQGGPLTEDEAAAFEHLDGWQDAVQLREWDDAGKVDGLPVPALATYRELLARTAK